MGGVEVRRSARLDLGTEKGAAASLPVLVGRRERAGRWGTVDGDRVRLLGVGRSLVGGVIHQGLISIQTG